VEDGSLRLAADAWRALEALCFALEESSAASRLIVTCRYYSAKELPSNRLFVEGLSGMLAIDIGKKTRALVSGVPAAQRNPEREEKIVQVADGNPRLLERPRCANSARICWPRSCLARSASWSARRWPA
jgi:hypothetical protein